MTGPGTLSLGGASQILGPWRGGGGMLLSAKGKHWELGA